MTKYDTRDRLVTVKFTQREYDEISRVADEKGLPFSTFIRFSALAEVRKDRPVNTPHQIFFKKKRHEMEEGV